MIAFYSNNETQFPPLDPTGYTWAAIGDSITEGTGVSLDSERYTELVATNKTMTLTNLGESGQTLTTNIHKTGLKTKLASAYGNDLITVLAGTNDWSFNIPLGSSLNSDDSTIKSCVNYFIDQIKANSPGSTILFLLTPYRSRDMFGSIIGIPPVNDLGLTVEDYNAAIKEVCIARKERYLNLYDVPDLTKETVNDWTTDGLHPNVSGNIGTSTNIINYFS